MITRDDVEKAIDYFIFLEGNGEADYDVLTAYNRSTINEHRETIRKFGEQIRPATLEQMQEVFYSFTNSTKYSQNAIARSVARTALSTNWSGIGDWLD